MKSRLPVTALSHTVAQRGSVGGCVVHTDRGSQFRSRRDTLALDQYDMLGSIGRVGAAGDNAAMEVAPSNAGWLDKVLRSSTHRTPDHWAHRSARNDKERSRLSARPVCPEAVCSRDGSRGLRSPRRPRDYCLLRLPERLRWPPTGSTG